MRPAFIAIAAGLVVFCGFAPIVPGQYVPGASSDRSFSMTDALLHSGMPQTVSSNMFSMAVQAAETSIGITDLSQLLKTPDGTALFVAGPSVSTPVTGTQTVRKIGYGNETLVSIVTTQSGTYSSDGLASPNVLYPGIDAVAPLEVTAATRILLMGNSGAWTVTEITQSNSFVTFGLTRAGDQFIAGRSSSCFIGRDFAGCS